MIHLNQFSKIPNKPDPSPFCVKCEIFMKMNDIEHKCRLGNVQKAPKKKLPYIEDGETIICDSEDILHYLAKKFDIDMDKDLSNREKAISFGMRKMLEEHFYFLLVYARWIDDEGWADTSQTMKKLFPPVLRSILPGVIRKGLKKTLHGQGTGRHSHEEIVVKVNEVFQSLESLLDGKDFLMGDKPTLLDVSAFSFLTAVANYPSFATKELQKYKSLVDYEKRIAQQYYTENS
ncbi:glutathione S-transferase family protein [Candidatus Uabimicrobium amorphum]|uniref:GST N-terminal domain-containing protein n=1 Tax=Uabimicrobium amorphum TaxID=2596890 RepID=A0A5S9IMJ3_UABAM|nr:glutathione S-transferase family protein [Candidatus Uabimicrobium amorphum]BBM84280.1 hypothetical protein UABAM_02637 [Candidatus Uabimicrobium amorphum]